MNTEQGKAFSLDNERFNFGDIGEVLDHLDCYNELEVGRTYWTCDCERLDPTDCLDIDDILENAQCQIDDLIGESAEDAFMVSEEARAELESILAQWVEKHVTERYWRCVNIQERKVTSEDIAEWSKS